MHLTHAIIHEGNACASPQLCFPPSTGAVIAAGDSPGERASESSSARGRKEAQLDSSRPYAPAETAPLSASGENRAGQAAVGDTGCECKRHDDGDHEVVERALDAIGQLVKHYRVYLKPLFQASS